MRVETSRQTGRRIGCNPKPTRRWSPPCADRRRSVADSAKMPTRHSVPPLSGRCPARFADPCRRKTPTGGSRESHRRPQTARQVDRQSHLGPLRRRRELLSLSCGRMVPGNTERSRVQDGDPPGGNGIAPLHRLAYVAAITFCAAGPNTAVLAAETCRARQQFDRCPIHASLH